jgi:FHA domain-containing protein
MSTSQPLRLEQGDLYTPQVEAYLEAQEVLRRPVPEIPPQPLLYRILFSSYFYLSLASGLGAFCGWAIMEQFFEEQALRHRVGGTQLVVALLLFPTVVGMVGLFLGAAEGLMCRNISRAAICGLVGMAVGFVGGLVATIIAGIIYGVMGALVIAFWKNPQPGKLPGGFALLLQIMSRGMAWAIAGIPAGLGQGIALRERRVIINGLLGGVLGGLLGGLLFDPLFLLLDSPDSAWVSRAVGFTTIGLMVGLFVGLVEQWTKTAWLLMRAGPLAGKQFIIYRSPTVLGSSPKADIYLFKDAAIEPRHALLHNRGGRFEIEDLGTPDGTYVNGIPVQKKHVLQSGDKIVLGKTVLEFVLKEASS